jgi:hypothetical protein
MWPITARLAESLAASNQTVATQLDILLDGVVVLTVVGATAVDAAGHEVSLVDGSVTVDRATVGRRATITIADASDVLRPDQVGDLLVPLRSEVRPWRGLLHADRTSETYPADRELVPLGTLVVAKVAADWPTITLTCYDRMWLLDRYRFPQPYTVPRGSTTTSVLAELIAARMPAGRGPTNFPDNDDTTGLIVWDEQDSPAERTHDLAEAAGLMLYVDPLGVFTARPEPTTADTPVWTFAEGPGSMLLPWPIEELSGENAYNAVVATGEPQDGSAAVWGYAENSNPESATYAGAVGPVVLFFSSPLLVTSAGAAKAAATLLAKQGLSDQLALSTLVHPALASGDVVYVHASHPAGTALALIADTFTVPVAGPGPMPITCRARVLQ